MVKIILKRLILVMFLCLVITSCRGTLTVNAPNKYNKAIRKVFVAEKQTSYKVPINFIGAAGVLGGAIGGAMAGLASKDMKKYEVPAIGKTYLHIKNFFEKSGYTVVSGNLETIPTDIDAVVDYDDYWEWDLKYYLKMLKITFKDPKTGNIFAEGLYKASRGGLHDYPSSEREVPKLISAILEKLPSE